MNEIKHEPLNKRQVLEKLKNGTSLEGEQIASVDFSDHIFKHSADFSGAKFTGSVIFRNAKFIGERQNIIPTPKRGRGSFVFENAEFSKNGNIDFSNAQFLNEGEVSFKNAIFLGNSIINFHNTRFSNTGNVDFSNIHFEGDSSPSFAQAEFSCEKHVWFSLVKFCGRGGVDFIGSKFSGQGGVNFQKAEFSGHGALFELTEFTCKGSVYFTDAKFLDKCVPSFEKALFACEGDVDFSATEFSTIRATSFDYAKFRNGGETKFFRTIFSGKGGTYFRGALFACPGGVDFHRANFCGGDLFDSTNQSRGFPPADFSKSKIRNNCWVNFSEAEFEENKICEFIELSLQGDRTLFFIKNNLSCATFSGTDLGRVVFQEVRFRELSKGDSGEKRQGLMDEYLLLNKNEKERNDSDRLHSLETSYRMLKRNYEEMRDYPKAGDFYYGEMEMKRLQLNLPFHKEIFTLIGIY